MKIAFVHDWPINYEQELTWRDGLSAALAVLKERGHDVTFIVCGDRPGLLPHPYFDVIVTTNVKKEVEHINPDVVLMWGDCTRPNAKPVSELGLPMALCFAGGQVDGPTMQYFSHFFVESQVYKERFEALGKSVSTAFGTNTGLFKPLKNQAKLFDTIFPATFARWKRHDLYAALTAKYKSVACGYFVPQEMQCVNWCENAGNLVLPHVSGETLKRLYAASKVCVITSHWTGGSQRTCLEAMAMNIPVICMKDSDKISEYVAEQGDGIILDPESQHLQADFDKAFEILSNKEINSREYILSKWSEYKYADALEQGLQKCLQSQS